MQKKKKNLPYGHQEMKFVILTYYQKHCFMQENRERLLI